MPFCSNIILEIAKFFDRTVEKALSSVRSNYSPSWNTGNNISYSSIHSRSNRSYKAD